MKKKHVTVEDLKSKMKIVFLVLQSLVKEHTEQNINHRLLIWSLMSFEWWCKTFLK
jgi:hypothetical protein